jgi:hydroxyacylglutathione hydrolase
LKTPLFIKNYVFGPLQNNTYILADSQTNEAIIIDPAMGSDVLVDQLKELNLALKKILISHAHFDHIACAGNISNSLGATVEVGLHPNDLQLWKSGGGSKNMGFYIDPGPLPTLMLEHGQLLHVGKIELEIRHVPGHTPGHVAFYCRDLEVVFCGDLLFYHGVGRTDLPGGNYEQLISSIRNQIFTLPIQTRLLCGHGPETSVAEEIHNNPFLQ